MTRLRIVVVGTLASSPYAGMAWMHMQIAAGFQRLGHEVYYFETTSNWPYDPVRQQKVADSDYAVPYLQRVAAAGDFAWLLRLKRGPLTKQKDRQQQDSYSACDRDINRQPLWERFIGCQVEKQPQSTASEESGRAFPQAATAHILRQS